MNIYKNGEFYMEVYSIEGGMEILWEEFHDEFSYEYELGEANFHEEENRFIVRYWNGRKEIIEEYEII